MHAYLIVSKSQKDTDLEIEKKLKKEKAKGVPFDFQKIDDARELRKFVKFSFNEKIAIVIRNIDKATIEASNAFLKNLEEPTKNIIYLLTSANFENVLPTISSRCEIIRVRNSEKQAVSDDATSFLNMNTNDKLNFVSKIKDRQEAISFIEDLISTDHQNGNFKNMENYLKTIKNLKSNGNVSLQMTSFVVTMNR